MKGLPEPVHAAAAGPVPGAAPTIGFERDGRGKGSRHLSRRRKWLFRLLALSLPLAALCLLELALTWMGAGRDLQLIQPAGRSVPAGIVRFNPDADRVYYGAISLGGPEPRPFELPKPAGTFRIVVVGGSTVFGFPYAAELAFPRLLEITLDKQNLRRNFEVLNAGIVAINSMSEVDVLQQALACDPDLVISYTGHNEFIGPGGVGSKFGGIPPACSPAFYSVRRTRLFQIAFRMLGLEKRDERPLVEQLSDDLRIPWDGDKYHRAEAYLRTNLERMVQAAARAGVPLLLTTPIANLRDQAPLASLPRSGLTAAERDAFNDALNMGERLLGESRPHAALEAVERARAIDARHALLHYRRAQCLEKLGRLDEAARSYQTACDLDGCRIRAPGSFSALIAGVAADPSAGRPVRFLDTAAAFARQLSYRVPGDESFLEHVHFTYEGNWRLAIILAQYIVEDLLQERWREDLVPAAADRHALCGAILQDHFVAKGLILNLLRQAPLDWGADVPSQIQAMQSECRWLFDDLPTGEGAILGALNLARLRRDLLGELTAGYDQAGLFRERAELLRQGVVRQPWRIDFILGLAEWEFREGRIDAARDLLERGKKWNGDSARLRNLRHELNRAGKS
jgi:hypothetical protein